MKRTPMRRADVAGRAEPQGPSRAQRYQREYRGYFLRVSKIEAADRRCDECEEEVKK
jgi:hypothetical protein